MTALAADRDTKKREGKQFPVPVAADAVIYAGAGVCVDSTDGYGYPAADTANFISMGIAQEQKDNTGGSDGDLEVVVDGHSAFEVACSSADQTWLGQDVYWVDDQTVALAATTTNDIKAGKVIQVNSSSSLYVDPQG